MSHGKEGTVLILEDDPGVARLQQRRLERAGYTALSARTPQEALAQIEQGGVELLLLDYRLPDEVNGLDFYAQLKERGHDLPVILVTGFSDDATVIRALRAGVRDFVTKSVEYLDYLPEAAQRVLKQVRTERQLVESEKALRQSNQVLEQALAVLQVKSEKVQAMTQQLWQAAKLATVGELAASIAHELNNPLATVSLRIEALLVQTPTGDPRRRPLEIVEQETERMSQLVANLLQYSRVRPEQVSTVDVREELTKAVELIQYHLRHRQIQFVYELPAELPLIYADRQQLRQVFLNLLTNASDAMPQGGTLTVRAGPGKLENSKPAVVIECVDTGVGIAPAHLARVMEPFFTTKEEGKGTGLGLAICRRIIQEHHGTMHLESVVGQGTTVRLTLPVANGTNAARLRQS